MMQFTNGLLMIFVVAILGSIAVTKLSACAPAIAPEVTKSVAYGAELRDCLDAGDYERREQCALGVDAKFEVKR